MAFAIDYVREIAARHEYTEVSINKLSRMISFLKGSTRINVYYTTGTIGTCLNHPKKGKTQLFRRNVSAELLDAIFENPRIHTDHGYHYTRKSMSQQWKQVQANTFEWDSARRWRYVGMATTLFDDHSEQVLEMVADICAMWDCLYWDAGDKPDLYKTKYACGSHGGLMHVMFRIARDVGITNVCNWEDLKAFHNGEVQDISTEIPYAHDCHNRAKFCNDHKRELSIIKGKMSSLPDEIKIEVIRWFLGRDACGFVPIDEHFQEVRTDFTDAVDQAHLDYADLMYPKKWKMCPRHGVMFSDHD